MKGTNMHIWTIEDWKKNLPERNNRRTGLRLKIDASVDSEVRLACKEFCKWLRTEYYFPLRVPIYIKSSRYIKTIDGDYAVGSFFEPNEYNVEPYIRIATGDYQDLFQEIGRDDALASILATIAHELTHYYQWINGITLTEIGHERQALRYSKYILQEYSETREHP